MTPKEKAQELYDKYIKYCNELSHDKNKVLCKLMVSDCISEIVDFASKQGIREPIMYLNMVQREVGLL